MSFPRRSCIFPGCKSVQGNGSVSLFQFPTNYDLRKRWIDFVKKSYGGEFDITTNTRLCSIHFTPDSFTNYHEVRSGFLKSPLTLVSGATPTLSDPGLHAPVALREGATIMATGVMCAPPILFVQPTSGAIIPTTAIACPLESTTTGGTLFKIMPTVRHVASQTDPPESKSASTQHYMETRERKSVATQLSLKTLQNHRSKATQARPSSRDCGVCTLTVPLDSPLLFLQPTIINGPSKRPRLSLEDEEEGPSEHSLAASS